MKVFAAVNDAEVIRIFYEKTGMKLNYLISYFYLDGQAYRMAHEYRHMINELYLDSGAFSVAGGRSKITVTEYCKYLKLYGEQFTQYFNLDDRFDDPAHNQWNQEYLEKKLTGDVKKPIPVVHDTEDPFAEFSQYVDSGHDYIAIGSTIDVPDETMVRIRETFPDVKIHLFGKIAVKNLKSSIITPRIQRHGQMLLLSVMFYIGTLTKIHSTRFIWAAPNEKILIPIITKNFQKKKNLMISLGTNLISNTATC